MSSSSVAKKSTSKAKTTKKRAAAKASPDAEQSTAQANKGANKASAKAPVKKAAKKSATRSTKKSATKKKTTKKSTKKAGKTTARKRSSRVGKRQPFEIAGISVEPGSRGETSLRVGRLVTGIQLSMPLIVLHGTKDGPTVWINAAVHGDEINGVEITRRVVEQLEDKEISGTVLVVPIVNAAGFIGGDRYLPDRRDLNRCFPGSARGSLGSRMAKVFMTEVVERCSVGIDLHTGSDHRTNLPQIRANLNDPPTRRLAEAFGTQVMIHAKTLNGSLREAATKAGAAVLLFEGGEAWRFGEDTIRIGVTGCLRVLHALDMIDAHSQLDNLSRDPIELQKTRWVRARASGITHLWVGPADRVTKGQTIGRLYDSFGHRVADVTSPIDGVVIGQSLDPTVNQGDAIVHIGSLQQPE